MVKMLSGKFAIGKNANGTAQKGNFTGFTDRNVQTFIAKRLMDNLKWSVDKDVLFPFFAMIETKKVGSLIAKLDKDGIALEPIQLIPLVDEHGVAIMTDRVEVVAIFKTEEEMKKSAIEENKTEREVRREIASEEVDFVTKLQESASAKGLSRTVIESIVQGTLIG